MAQELRQAEPDRGHSVPSPGPRPRDSEIDIFGLTHPGKLRTENQDHFFVGQLKKQIHVHSTSLPEVAQLPVESERLAFLVMVADGVGGSSVGEKASRLALEWGVVPYVEVPPDDTQETLRIATALLVREKHAVSGDIFGLVCGWPASSRPNTVKLHRL